MPNINDIRGLLAEEIANLHERLDTLHQRAHSLFDEVVQEASSQFEAGNNPLIGQAQHNAPGGFTPVAPTSAPAEESSSSTSGQDSSSSSSSQSSSSSSPSSTSKSSDTGSSGTSQPK